MKYKNIFSIDLFEDGLIIKNVNTTCDINTDSIEHESKNFTTPFQDLVYHQK